MLKLLKYLSKKDWILTIISCAFIVVNVYCELEIPDYMSKITNIIVTNGPVKEVLVNGVYMLTLAIASVISIVIAKFFSSKVAMGLGRKIRSEVYGKVIDFSDAEIKHFSTASLITRTTNDVTQVQNVIAMGMTLLVKAPVMSIMAIIKIVNINIAWSLATASAVLLMLITLLVIVFVALPRFKRVQVLTDNLTRVTREGLTGARVVRAFNAEKYQSEKFEKANTEIAGNHLFVSRVMSLIDPTMTIVMNGLPLSVYIIGSILINDAVGIEKLSIFKNMIGCQMQQFAI